MIILGIETSCDETACCVIDVQNDKVKILSNIISSQIEIHKKYGGVVPEIAARQHVLNIIPVVDKALKKAKIKDPKKLSAIAVTYGPGLITSLIPGIETAKTLSFAWNVPIIPINHIEGHLYSNFIENKNIEFPNIILTASGGHTNLILMKGHGKYEIIGQTLDDAVGEAFDKAAKMLGIGYPGGPVVSEYAKKAKKDESIAMPRPMLNKNNFDFSFSGLKTSLLYQIQKDKNWKKKITEYCYEFQEAATDVLTNKTIKAAKKYNVKAMQLSGGVSANKNLREKISKKLKKEIPSAKLYLPNLKYTTDNAVMIAMAGYYKAKDKKNLRKYNQIKVDANSELK